MINIKLTELIIVKIELEKLERNEIWVNFKSFVIGRNSSFGDFHLGVCINHQAVDTNFIVNNFSHNSVSLPVNIHSF